METALIRRRRGGSALALYAANGLRPTFVLDPSLQKYFTDGSPTNLAGAVTHARASGATYLDSNGVLQTAASGEIRDQAYAYVDGVLTGPYLQHESAAATNLLPYSEDFTNADWSKLFGGTGSVPVVTANYAVSPSGAVTADRVVFDTGAGTGTSNFSLIANLNILTSGTTYTQSIWLSATSGTQRIYLYTTGGAFSDVLSGEVIELTAGEWKRVTQTRTATATATGNMLSIGLFGQDGIAATTADILVWGGQLEQGPIPTSYIPTSGSTATRAAETLTIDTPPWPAGSAGSRGLAIAMDGLMTYADGGLASQVQFLSWLPDFQNFIRFRLDTAGANTGNVVFEQRALNVNDAVSGVTPGTYSPGVNVPFSIASRHGDSFLNGAVGGTARTADLTPTILPDLSATSIQIAPTFNGFIDTLRIWDVDIGDTGISEAST